jgi:hypothetical protein
MPPDGARPPSADAPSGRSGSFAAYAHAARQFPDAAGRNIGPLQVIVEVRSSEFSYTTHCVSSSDVYPSGITIC